MKTRGGTDIAGFGTGVSAPASAGARARVRMTAASIAFTKADTVPRFGFSANEMRVGWKRSSLNGDM